jgi:L-ascorbate metabolism protein UlaG (beta-lactamase superfamily)
MSRIASRFTLMGGPTLLIELAGFRILTDPTFDPPERYDVGGATLTKIAGPALPFDSLRPINAVLLSHDHHVDNRDKAGRSFLPTAERVYTTTAGAQRLGGNATGLRPWEERQLEGVEGSRLYLTAAPARHGPPGVEKLAGDVIGFLLGVEKPGDAVYVTGDTVWYEGVAEVARRYDPRVVVLFAGSAKPRGPFHLTMDSNDALETAKAFPNATILPVHTDDWTHFTENAADLAAAFSKLGQAQRLAIPRKGEPLEIRL